MFLFLALPGKLLAMKYLPLMILAAAIAGCGSNQDDKSSSSGKPKETPAGSTGTTGAEVDPPKDILKTLLDASLPEWKEQAPASFKAKFATSKGDFIIQVDRAWSPLGADRFYNLVKNGYYDDVRFFRVVDGFMVQFGIHGNPDVNKVWGENRFRDDPVVKSNTRGWVTYAKTGAPHSRTTQIFINFEDRNRFLDPQGFSPFGRVIEGMDVVDKLYKGYGERPSQNQMRIQAEGNAYLNAQFKELDYVKTARIVK
jgi:peptidyl-prolyl cis-trans isomerase A (cyclophilin A)